MKRWIAIAGIVCVTAGIVAAAWLLPGCSQAPAIDENGMYFAKDHAFHAEGPLREEGITRLAEKINAVVREFAPASSRAFCSVVPDKSWYAKVEGAPTIDHEALASTLAGGLSGAQYIELAQALTLEDYYTTDSHWRQERLQKVLDTLGEKMDFSVSLSDYRQEKLDGFRGMNCRYDAERLPAETLTYLTSDALEKAGIANFERPELSVVYETEKFEGFAGYDVFLSGPAALVTLTADEPSSGRELVLFRDSFGSSLAPLLLGAYDRITLIDLRYMASELIPEFAPIPENADVLFLYSTPVANNSRLLK